jgi:ABC-type dipeptide/oligopeptide/nickel transport system ATPase component
MEIKNRNFYETEIVKSLIKPVHNPNYDIHKLAVPLIACVVGGTGSGKTNLLMNILEVMDQTFNKIIIFTMDRDEPLYNALSSAVPPDQLKIFEGIANVTKQNMDKNIDRDDQTLLIFDDLCNSREAEQRPIGDMYIRGRKLNCSMLYLSQKWSCIPTIIRAQCGYVFLKQVDGKRQLQFIVGNYSPKDLTTEQINEIYKYCSQDKLDFLLIDLKESDKTKRFRRNLDEILDIDYFIEEFPPKTKRR